MSMNVLTYNPDVMTKNTVIPLGRACECRATRIEFEVSSWLSRFPGGEIVLYVKDPNDEAYLATITTENGVAQWVLNNTDTQVSGFGGLELALIGANGERKLSAVATTKIDPSLVEAELTERPEYMQPWIERAAEIQAATQTAAHAAADDANVAATEARAAEAARDAANVAANAAEGHARAAKDAAARAAALAEHIAPAIMLEASGGLASVDDAAELPAVQVVSEIKPSEEGVAAVKLTHTGRNLVSHLDYVITQYHTDTSITEDVIDVKTPSNFDYGKIPVKLKGGATYTLVIDWEVYGRAEDATGDTTCSYRIDKLQTTAFQGRVTENAVRRFVKVYTATEDIDANILWYPNFGGPVRACSRSRVMLLVGEYTADTAPAFEHCRKQTMAATLPETVHGGTLDWTSGLLTITHGTDGAELATPRTRQLDPQQLDMLHGCNALWSDTGDTALVCIADTRLYIVHAVAALAASILNV